MKLIKGMFACIMLMFVALTFFACEVPTLPELSCSGTIIFNDEGLENVTISSDVKEYGQTNQNGEYFFTTNAKTLKIFPVKEGYMFTPRFAELNAGQNSASFVATKIEALQGTLSLSKIVITPTSILKSPDNYVYENNGQSCLKPKEIYISCNSSLTTLNQELTYLTKKQQNEFLISLGQNISFNCGEELKLGVLINAYFIAFNQEAYTTDTEFAYLEITKPQTNADLNNSQIEYTLYGINNKARTFTFDIMFVFDYISG